MAQKEQCFIITPIGDDTDPIRRHIEGIIDAAIIPALGDQYEIVVAHKISEPGSITKQVIDKVYHSKLVIANLTNRNPNVMYELALRHATGKPAIMIAEKGTPLPSDIIMQRTIFYHNDAKGVLELRDALKKAAYEIDFEKKVGPIVEVLGDISHDADMLKKVAEKDSDSREPLEYILRRLDQIESAISKEKSVLIRKKNCNSGFVADCDGLPSDVDVERLRDDIQLRLDVDDSDLTYFDIEDNVVRIRVNHPASLLWGEIASPIHRILDRHGFVFKRLEQW